MMRWMAREFDFLDWIGRQQRDDARVPIPSGDDLAGLKWKAGDLLLIGADQVADGVHFDSRVHTPHAIGAKAMNRNLSDCAAMGCLPAAAVATVALPRRTSLDYAKELYRGMRWAGEKYGCKIVGGDTAVWSGPLILSLTILGRSAGVAPVRRNGAKVGDWIYVTGSLGGSLLGRHMSFEPRLRLGRSLARRNLASAMCDLSDGLSRDLRNICRASGVGAIVESDRIPIHDDVMRLAGSPLGHAINDGEDYELLFTSSRHVRGAVRIGRIVKQRGMWLEKEGRRQVMKPGGWEHGT